jgi:hypothetical protein
MQTALHIPSRKREDDFAWASVRRLCLYKHLNEEVSIR